MESLIMPFISIVMQMFTFFGSEYMMLENFPNACHTAQFGWPMSGS
jgi:hypothetical protein